MKNHTLKILLHLWSSDMITWGIVAFQRDTTSLYRSRSYKVMDSQTLRMIASAWNRTHTFFGPPNLGTHNFAAPQFTQTYITYIVPTPRMVALE